VAGFLEREGLLVTDGDNDYLTLDWPEDDPMLQIHGYSITRVNGREVVESIVAPVKGASFTL